MDANEKARNKKFANTQNKKAIDDLEKKKDKKNEAEEDQELIYRKLSIKERLDKDYQLNKAFDTISAIEKFKKMSEKRANEKK